MPQPSEDQAAFAAALRSPEMGVPGDIASGRSGPATKRFNVYRNNVAVAEVEALAATFPAVKALVGDPFFEAAARLYATETPPRSPLLFLYGGSFPEFLDTFEPARTVPYLGDVARIEWARLRAYHAPDAEPATIGALAALSEAEVGTSSFIFHPSASIHRSDRAAFSIWAATSGLMDGAGIDPNGPEDVLVVRPHLTVETRLLPPGAYPFIAALMAGHTLVSAAEAGAQILPDFDLAHHLSGLFETGAVTGLTPPPRSADSSQDPEKTP